MMVFFAKSTQISEYVLHSITANEMHRVFSIVDRTVDDREELHFALSLFLLDSPCRQM